jgi:glucose/arabinose dehydrogenase
MLARIFLETAVRMKFLTLSFFFIAISLRAATLPGFRIETIATVPDVVSSVVTDSRGTIYCTTTSGSIYRIDNGVPSKLTSLNTHSGGNAGLLGMALVDDNTAAVHYTTWSGEVVLDDVISLVDLASGTETVLHTFVCDIEVRERGASAEHHGGNPTIGPDGAIFAGIGEYNTFVLAQEPEWNGGKIFRIDRDGNATQFARGVRNPYDLAWDPEMNRLVFTDNGPDAGDEMHVISEGANAGWPNTVGNELQVNGSVPPVYVFPVTVAPTGLLRLTPSSNALLRRGYLSGSFVARSLFYFSDLTAHPVAAPYPIVEDYDEAVIDVTQAPNGEVYFSTVRFPSTSHIQHLIVPKRGDCDGDGNVDWHDLVALNGELGDAPEPMLRAQDGTFAGTWGCDVNADGTIDKLDLSTLTSLLTRRRAVATH